MNPQSVNYLIRLLNFKLINDESNWSVTSVITNWQVSFIRAFYKPDMISVDISFENGIAVETTDLLSHLFDIQPEAAKFILLIKKWLKMYNVGMKNYNLVLLVVFFLQQHDYLPSIETVQENTAHSVVIAGHFHSILY